jgi:hypothetical protein
MLNLSFNNQAHYGDLLLVNENAGYYKDVEKADNLPFIPDPYTIGPQLEGHSEITHHKFIGEYIKSVSNVNYKEHLKAVVYNPDRKEEIDELIGEEEFTIQIEMLIYLKIWESDTFIKKMYQLARLINGENYDWHFKIKGHDKNDSSGLPRSVLLNDHVKRKFKGKLPKLYNYFNTAYKTQIRNAIAHSQYSILGRSIILNNYIEGSKKLLSHITFDEWTKLFHQTIVLYTLYTEFFNRVNDIYYNNSLIDNSSVEVRINRLYPIAETRYMVLYTRPFFKDWSPFKPID